MFDHVAVSYRRLNTILTFGRDNVWRRYAVGAAAPAPGQAILDICTGTGDMAIRLARTYPESSVTGLDYSSQMLEAARQNAARAGGSRQPDFVEADCRKIPFADDSFEVVTAGFGFRNLSADPAIQAGSLKEILRVLKKGGRFVILESSQPSNGLLRRIFSWYASIVVPFIGGGLSGQKEAYVYLGHSMKKFYDGPGLRAVLEQAGFRVESQRPFMAGAILLSVFRKP